MLSKATIQALRKYQSSLAGVGDKGMTRQEIVDITKIGAAAFTRMCRSGAIKFGGYRQAADVTGRPRKTPVYEVVV